MTINSQPSETDLLEFAPAILRMNGAEVPFMSRGVLYVALALFVAMLVWSSLGQLDVVAVAQGKLIPSSYTKIVQPAESGILRDILVKDGDEVRAGQVLMRMDTEVSDADRATLETDLVLLQMQLHRIEAETTGSPFTMTNVDRPELLDQVMAQYRANREAYTSQIASEKAVLAKAEQELSGALEMESGLRQTVPIYREQEVAHEQLVRDGFFSKLAGLDKTRERIEKEQELKAQMHQVESLRASIEQSRRRLVQIASAYRQQLQNERAGANAQRMRLEQEAAKHDYRRRRLELRAPQDGMVKDLATHTSGAVVSPGTILMTLVPHNDPVKAEVWVTNEDAGFIEVDQPVKLKVSAFPFNKYGMVKGRVEYLSPDGAELPDVRERDRKDGREHVMPPSGFRALVTLDTPYLERDGRKFNLSAGMLVSAEVHLGTRTVMEYLWSPMQKTVLEAGRER